MKGGVRMTTQSASRQVQIVLALHAVDNMHRRYKKRLPEKPVHSVVRLAGIEPAHPVPETGALSPEL